MAIDPICGMTVNEENAKILLVIDGEVFFFCSASCKERYQQGSGWVKTPAVKKGFFRRFLEKVAQTTEKSYGKKPPTCH